MQVDADPVRGVPQWELLVEQLAPGMLAAGLVTERDLRAFGELLHDGVTVVFAPLMVSSWGRRPASGDGPGVTTTAISYAQAMPAHRALRRFAATRVGDWLFANVLRRLDGPVYRLTSGRHTAANLLSGLPVVHLTTTGARTGRASTVPVLGIPTPEGLAVIASNFGRPRQPGWYHNLRAHPDATVTVRGDARRCAPSRRRVRNATGSGGRGWRSFPAGRPTSAGPRAARSPSSCSLPTSLRTRARPAGHDGAG